MYLVAATGETIEEDTKALQCEKCVDTETWKCARCLDISDELYDQLVASSKCNLHWFRSICEAVVLDADVNSNDMVDKVTPVIEKLQTKSDDIAQHLSGAWWTADSCHLICNCHCYFRFYNGWISVEV